MTNKNILLKFLNFQDFINDYLVFIIIGLAVILLVLIGILISIKMKKKNYNRQLQLVQQEYISARQIALPDAISKLETLAIKNISFVKIYKESNSKFYEINDMFNGKINEKFELVQKAANEGEYKLFYKELNDLKTIIGCFKEELISLFEKVRSYTSDEDKILDSLKKLKEKFVHEQKIFNDNATALAIIAPRIKDMMKHISIMFDDCEGNLNAGVYVECFEIIEKIDKEINELSEYLNKMPGLLTWASQNIVKKLNELIDKNNAMQSEYPLHHLLPTRKIERLTNEFYSLIERIKGLDSSGMEEYMRDLYNQINELSDALDNEKESRIKYDEECETLYDLSDRTNRDFLKLQKEMDSFNRFYSITKEMEAYRDECIKFKDELTSNKQNMDHNIYGHQPYSIRYENIKKLKQTCEAFREHMNAFPNMAARLKEDAENAHSSISIFANRIKMAKINIDNCNLPLFAKKYSDKLIALEEKLNILIQALRAPVKIQIAMSVKKELEIETLALQEEVERKVKMMDYCEELITISNRYRLNFGEVNNAVSRAIAFFNEGEFDLIVPLLLKLNSFEIEYPTYDEFILHKRG